MNDEIISLNDNVLNDFDIEELEARYETYPLMFSHIFGLSPVNDDIDGQCLCNKLKDCPELTCLCKGGFECGNTTSL